MYIHKYNITREVITVICNYNAGLAKNIISVYLQIFSISNNSTLFKQAYPDCWSKFTHCNEVYPPLQ